ncbi:hypothetical protein FPANT_7535 [Fusarium pseudoanthophilum]|uniref:Uncharacterized protein n=1 Tax=Fusarium pseudoanthophilum TaxID=48495 RepID=A0A8H5P260_9HYPO|nr:hypothetical protein FPANT_7535 [Fusarium pseudoanthophilum]
MDNRQDYTKPYEELQDNEATTIKQYMNDGNVTSGNVTPSEARTARTGISLRTTQVNLSDLSEDRKHILAARMKQTRDEWDRSEFSASTVDGGSVAHSHKASQVGFSSLANRRQGQRTPAVPALTARGQRATRSLGGGRSWTSTREWRQETNIDTLGSLAGGFVPALKAHTAAGALPALKSPAATGPFVPATTGIGGSVPGPKAPTGISHLPHVTKAPTATGAFIPASKTAAANSAFVPATTTGIGGFMPGPKAPTATGAFAPVPTAHTGVSGFPPAPRAPTTTGGFGYIPSAFAPKAPTTTGGYGPIPKAPSVISATTTVLRDPSVSPGQSTTAPSLKIVKDADASQLGTGSSEQTEEQFKELIDEMAALQQSMSVNEQKQRWMFFNLQKQRKEKGE